MLVSTRLYDSALDPNFAAAAQIFLRELAKELKYENNLTGSAFYGPRNENTYCQLSCGEWNYHK